MQIGERGVFFYPDGLSSREAVAFARRIEALGYSALWLPEAGGRDPFVLAAHLLDHTETLIVATGIANIYARDAVAMKAAQYTLAEQSGGRFLLGIGVSHRLLVEDIRGHVYGPPLPAMKAFLDRYAAAGFGAVEPAERPPVLLAALGPKMLDLARERADGAHPYMVTPEHTREARKRLGPDRLLCSEHKVLLEKDSAKARAIARAAPALAVGLTLPNYQNSLIRQGFEAKDFENGLSDRLIDALVATGSADAIERRLAEHLEAGADHVCIHPLHPEAKSEPWWPTLEALAPREPEPLMDYWLSYIDEDPDQTLEVARAAERAGYTGMALADHVCVPLRYASQHPSGGPTPFDHRSPFPDPLVTAASVLASTQRFLVMTYVYVLPMREPFSVASQVATLDRLSDSRFRFGVGAGWLEEEIALLGHPVRDRGRRMDEMLEIIQAFWTRDSVEYHGKHFDFEPAGIAPKPRQPVPIWVGGKSPSALARAVRHDGWLGMNYDLPEIHALLDDLQKRLARQRDATGEAKQDFEVFVIPNAAPDEALYEGLAKRGVTATMGSAWPYGDKSVASLGAKIDALGAFGERFIRR